MNRSGKTGRWNPASALSLFPFLAVLICVMGGLIVLLVVLARHSRVQAIRAAQAVASQKKSSLQQLQQDRELLQWQAEQIQESRTKTEAQLAEARLQLSGAEDHLRRLRQELAELQRAWQALEQSATHSTDQAQLEERLRQLQAEIVRRKQEVEQKKQTEPKPTVSYAIIPYQGPHGTQRRPIYIECRQEAIILQPEGILLTPRDFEGPVTEENPLARAVRAAREYWANQAVGLPEAQEPYPLLLVRPDGIVAYYTAREALAEWGSEFGYELIGQDWKLRFPPADPQLAQVLLQEVQLARARQKLLAEIAPRVAHRTKPLYRVGPRGIQLEDSGSGGGSRPVKDRFTEKTPGTKPLGPEGSEEGPNVQGVPGPQAGSAGGNGPAPGPRPPDSLADTRPIPSETPWPSNRGKPSHSLEWPTSRGYGQAAERGYDGPGGPGSGTHPAEAAAENSPLSEGPEGGSAAFGASNPPGPIGQRPMGTSPSSSSPPGGSPNAWASSGGGPSAGAFGGPMASLPEGATPDGSFSPARQWVGGVPASSSAGLAQSEASSPSSPGRRLRPGEWYDPPPKPSSALSTEQGHPLAKQPSGESKPLASAQKLRSVRGRNWALPEAADKAIPITRPIQVECYPDRLVLSPESPQKKEIRLGPKTLDSLDELVAAVWDHIESWGIAGRGMYWRPVLSVRVLPGGEHRFEELQSLLEESGLLIERRP